MQVFPRRVRAEIEGFSIATVSWRFGLETTGGECDTFIEGILHRRTTERVPQITVTLPDQIFIFVQLCASGVLGTPHNLTLNCTACSTSSLTITPIVWF